jgi:hypothetical protein
VEDDHAGDHQRIHVTADQEGQLPLPPLLAPAAQGVDPLLERRMGHEEPP